MRMAKCLFDWAFSANPEHRYSEIETDSGREMLHTSSGRIRTPMKSVSD